MSVLETVIRNALEKADRTDADVRARIYQSARTAFNNGLSRQGIADPAVIAKQRATLETLIRSIEAEEQKAAAGQTAADMLFANRGSATLGGNAAVPDVQPVKKPQADTLFPEEQMFSAEASYRDVAPPRPDPSFGSADGFGENRARTDRQKRDTSLSDSEVHPEKRVRRSRARSSVFTRIVVVSVLLFFGYMAAVWVNQSGLWAMIEQYRSGATDADTAESDDATPLIKNPMDPRRSFDSSWQDIFKAADTASLETSGDAAVEQASAADGAYALITSGSSGPTGNVSIPVSADILAGLAGKTSTIALTVGSGNDTSTQISVECLFPGLGDCGRHRFNVTAERGDFLLRLTLPAGNGTPSPGKIILSSDVTGGGKSIKLFAIRVTEEP